MNGITKKLAGGLALIICCAFSLQSTAATIGAAATDRSSADGWSNFVLGLTSENFTTDGTVTDWSVYTNNAGTLGMLLLRPTTGSNYEIIGADFQNANAGLNTFSFTADTGTASVMAGDILGLYIGTAKVDFDFTAGGIANWCGGSNCIADPVSGIIAGETLELTGGPQNRVYSANVNAVPLPAAAWLFGSAILGLVAAKRRKA